MKILVLHQHYWPEIAPTGQLLQDVCEDLARLGHDITVVCGQPSYRRIDGMARVLPARDEHHGVHVRRVWSYIPSQRSIARRLVHYGSYFSTSLAASLASSRPDVAFIMSSPPLLLGVSGTLLAFLRGVPFVYSVQDIYPDIAVDLGVLKPGVLYSAIDEVSRFLYQAAARVVTLSDGMAQTLAGKGVLSERLAVIPNWSDTDTVKPLPRDNDFARAHGLAEGFVVQYSGNVGLSQGLGHALEAADQVRDLPLTLAIIGDGNARASLEAEAKRRGLSNVKFLPPQPRSALPELLASSDVGLVSMKQGVGHNLVPSKLYGILAAGRPVLASVADNSEVARLVRGHGCGLVVAPEDPRALASAMRELFARRDELAAMGSAGRQACERQYSRLVCTTRYAEVLSEAAARASARSQAEAAPRASHDARPPIG